MLCEMRTFFGVRVPSAASLLQPLCVSGTGPLGTESDVTIPTPNSRTILHSESGLQTSTCLLTSTYSLDRTSRRELFKLSFVGRMHRAHFCNFYRNNAMLLAPTHTVDKSDKVRMSAT